MRYEMILSETYEKSKLEAINESSRSALRQIYRPKKEAVFETTNPLREKILVAKDGSREVGSLRLHYYSNRLHILGLGVLNASRGKGVCRAMIDFVRIQAIANEMKTISMYTIRETGNVEIFKRFGFVVSDESITSDFESDLFDDLHEVYMTLDLNRDCV